MTLRPLTLAVALAFGLVALPSTAAPAAPAAAAPQSKGQRLSALYDQYWEELLELNPVQATFQGDPRYNDRMPNFLSAEFRRQSHDFTVKWLDRVQQVGSDGLTGQDLLSYEIFVDNAKRSLEGEQFPDWMMPVNQMGSIASYAAMFGSGSGPQPFKTVQDYDNWLERAAAMPAIFDTAIANMREGVDAGVVQPRALMVKVVPQLDALINDDPTKTLFWGPVSNMPKDFSAADRERLTTAYRAMITTQVMPAYKRLRAYINDEYLPHTRETIGLDALPNGQAWYAYAARNSTTTGRTPAEIHQLGLDEVARIHGEIRKVMQQVGFKGSLQDFFQYMRTEPKFSFRTEDELLAFYRGLEQKVNAGIPGQFSLVPKSPFEIRPVEAFRAKSAAGGEYQSPSEDGSRPGIFYVNTYYLPTRKRWDAVDL
jgi:uncharacterized protein (DUF885 family)